MSSEASFEGVTFEEIFGSREWQFEEQPPEAQFPDDPHPKSARFLREPGRRRTTRTARAAMMTAIPIICPIK